MFSGAVKLEDVSDYILPSQDCVVQIVHTKPIPNSFSGGTTVPAVAAQSPPLLRPDLIKLRPKRSNPVDRYVDKQQEARRRLPRQEKQAPLLSSSGLADVPSSISADQSGQGPSGLIAATAPSTQHLDSPELKCDSPPRSAMDASADSRSVAQVSLYDCLACSGCVTTSETVLLKGQSVNAFLQQCGTASFSVVSFCPESIDFLTKYFGCTDAAQCFRKLTWIFKHLLKVSAVVETSTADAIVLLETLREFIERYKHSIQSGVERPPPVTGGLKSVAEHPLPMMTSHCPGWICYCEKTQGEDTTLRYLSQLKSSQQVMGHLVKTLLLTARNISVYRCAYQGSQRGVLLPAVQRVLERRFGISNAVGPDAGASPYPVTLSPGDVVHAVVVPCFDKKLEIVRKEGVLFTDTPAFSSHNGDSARFEGGTPEVDLALATVEVIELIERKLGLTAFADVPEAPLHQVDDIFLKTTSWFPWEHVLPPVAADNNTEGGAVLVEKLFAPPPAFTFNDATQKHPSPSCLCCHALRCVGENNASGGFLDYTFRQAAWLLFGIPLTDDASLPLRIQNNKDLKEVVLKVEGVVKLRFRLAYGFRNIQNVLRQLHAYDFAQSNQSDPEVGAQVRPISQPFQFVEVMACPGGCQRGGGQVAPPLDAKEQPQQQENHEQQASSTGRDQDGAPQSARRVMDHALRHSHSRFGSMSTLLWHQCASQIHAFQQLCVISYEGLRSLHRFLVTVTRLSVSASAGSKTSGDRQGSGPRSIRSKRLQRFPFRFLSDWIYNIISGPSNQHTSDTTTAGNSGFISDTQPPSPRHIQTNRSNNSPFLDCSHTVIPPHKNPFARLCYRYLWFLERSKRSNGYGTLLPHPLAQLRRSIPDGGDLSMLRPMFRALQQGSLLAPGVPSSPSTGPSSATPTVSSGQNKLFLAVGSGAPHGGEGTGASATDPAGPLVETVPLRALRW